MHFTATTTTKATTNQEMPSPVSTKAFFSRKKKDVLSEQQMADVQMAIYRHNEYEFVETETRNCLLCGRTRSGKTTTMGVLKDPCFSPKSQSIFSETQDPKFQSFSINNRANTCVQKFTINIIDTPGLFEVKDKNSIEEERTNEVLAQTIAKCLENEITHIHCIIMFLTFEAGINRDDIEAMKLFLDMFSGTDVTVALCVTHADKHSDSWRESIKEQLTKHHELSALIDREKMAILFMGCVDTLDKSYTDDSVLQDDYVSVYNMRKEMLEVIFSAQQKSMLNQMNVAKKKIEQVENVMDKIIKNYNQFCRINDFETSGTKELVFEHQKDIAFLSENSVYMNIPELADKFVTLLKAAENLKAKKMDKKLKISLLWPLRLRDEVEKNEE